MQSAGTIAERAPGSQMTAPSAQAISDQVTVT
jgi:hypothetical protein